MSRTSCSLWSPARLRQHPLTRYELGGDVGPVVTPRSLLLKNWNKHQDLILCSKVKLILLTSHFKISEHGVLHANTSVSMLASKGVKMWKHAIKRRVHVWYFPQRVFLIWHRRKLEPDMLALVSVKASSRRRQPFWGWVHLKFPQKSVCHMVALAIHLIMLYINSYALYRTTL